LLARLLLAVTLVGGVSLRSVAQQIGT